MALLTRVTESPSVPRALASALPDFALGAVFLVTWIAPRHVEPWVVKWLLLTMLLEFIIIHSTAVLGSTLYKARSMAEGSRTAIPLILFYCIFALGFSLGFQTPWPLISFLVLSLNRLTPLLTGTLPRGAEQNRSMAAWAGTTLCYLGGVFLTTLAPVPRFGLTSDVVATLHLTGGGLWISQPWRVIAFGALYFTSVGLLELQGFAAFQVKNPNGLELARD